MSCAVEPSIVQSKSALPSIFISAESLTLQAGQKKSLDLRNNEPDKTVNKLVGVSVSKDESVQLIPNLKEFIGFLLSCEIAEIRSVFMGQDGKLLRIFIVVDEYNFEVNERIYDREERVMDVFNHLDFDFHITCHHTMSDRNLEKVL
jgi:hypothetical protein